MAQDLRSASSARANLLGAAGDGFIEHRVSKLDTLAGVAIKYGVEVADVKRLNGLVSDFQMFAHKTLRIPVGRRHPTPPTTRSENLSLSRCPVLPRPPSKSKSSTQLRTLSKHEKRVREKGSLSLAMSLLRGYYGLSLPAQQQADGNNAGMEMASFKAEAEEHAGDEPIFRIAEVPISGSKNGYRTSNGVRASKSNGREVEGSLGSTGNGQMSDAEVPQTSIEGSVRRRFKAEVAIPPGIGGIDECKRDTCAFDRLPATSGLMGAMTESSGGLPMVILKVLDGALVGSGSGKGKDSPVKVKKSPSTANPQDPPTSSRGEVKSGSQSSSRTSPDTPPKPVNHRYKAAID